MNMIKKTITVLSLLTAILVFNGCEEEEEISVMNQPTGKPNFEVKRYAEWAGCRSSCYGMDDFPSEALWTNYAAKMASSYKKNEDEYSQGIFIWVVGAVQNNANKSCWLNFPRPAMSGIPSKTWNSIEFNDIDENESYFNVFDKAGFNVWLQVEAGLVDIVDLAKIVMTHYKDHPCIKGFGVDVEWYQNITDGNDGTPLDDETAQRVDEAVKLINPEYSVFVKHWKPHYLPSTYRGTNNDMIFVTDSQGFHSLDDMKEHYNTWADSYYPNPVFFQIGYEGRKKNYNDPNEIGSDEKIWSAIDKPLKGFGQAILDSLTKNDQKRGIIWVDFTFEKAYNMSK